MVQTLDVEVLDVVVVGVGVVVAEAHNGERRLRNQLINSTRNSTAITQMQCRPDICLQGSN